MKKNEIEMKWRRRHRVLSAFSVLKSSKVPVFQTPEISLKKKSLMFVSFFSKHEQIEKNIYDRSQERICKKMLNMGTFIFIFWNLRKIYHISISLFTHVTCTFQNWSLKCDTWAYQKNS